MTAYCPLNPASLGQLTPDVAVARFRELLFCEARYAGLAPGAVTISSNLYVPDGGIDADVEAGAIMPADVLLCPGINGFQFKTGTSFRPWQASALKAELVTPGKELVSEVRRILTAGGHYVLVCFGIDFTPKQRNAAQEALAALFDEHGFLSVSDRIDVLGQTQIASHFHRYPALRLALAGGSDADFLTIAEWSRHAHMNNEVILSDSQRRLVEQLRERLRGSTKHLRVLGEPGIGKTRLVLEALRAEDLAGRTLYIEHGHQFARSTLFRDLLRGTWPYPLVVVVDELFEREMAEIWAHLKSRCGMLKLVTIDHGPDRSGDPDIERFSAPRLPKETVRAILASHMGNGLSWIAGYRSAKAPPA